jgi:hypothetical protein
MKSRCVFVVIPLFGLMVGCGQSMATVKGRVTCNGKPVAEAQITFNPAPKDATDREPGKPATGFTDAEGNFVLSTFHARDGALIGTHRVTVMLDETNPARCTRQKSFTQEVKPGANEVSIELNQ